MTNDELAAKLDQKFDGIDQKFESIDKKFESIDKRFDAIDKRFESMERKVDDGFNDSKVRDENLRGLMTFGLEAREILRDEIHRRFDDTDRKNDEQISLLKDAVRHLSSQQ
jgi:septation ring formation regulator EzrA